MSREWNEESIIRLISLVREKPLIWNPQHESYKNKLKRLEAFNEISSTMNISSDEIKRKWKVIQTQFRREYVKSKTKYDTGSSEVYRSPWYGYKHLLFLKVANALKTPKLSKEVLRASNRIMESEDSQIVENIIVTPNELEIVKEEPEQNVDITRLKPLPKLSGSFLNPSEDSCNSPKFGELRESRDNCAVFSEYIANKLRCYDLLTRSGVEHKINCILHDADMMVLQHYDLQTQSHDQYNSFSSKSQ